MIQEPLLPLNPVQEQRDGFDAARPQTPADGKLRAVAHHEDYTSPSPYQSTNGASSPKSLARSDTLNSAPQEKVALTAPLSELTKSLSHTKVRDMTSYVNRPIDERLREVEAKKGKVSRPMNCFMLYRSAYAQRTKEYCAQTNHQVVSRIAGESWAIEPPHIRDHYENLASIERENHKKAHPEYKFTPSKVSPKRKRSVYDGYHGEENLDMGAYQYSPSYKRYRADMIPPPYMTYADHIPSKPAYSQVYNVPGSNIQMVPPYSAHRPTRPDQSSLHMARPTTAPHDMSRPYDPMVSQPPPTYTAAGGLDAGSGYTPQPSQMQPPRGTSLSPTLSRMQPQMVDYPKPYNAMSMARPHTSDAPSRRDSGRPEVYLRNSTGGSTDYRYQYKSAPAPREGPTSASLPLPVRTEPIWPAEDVARDQGNIDSWLL